jgi:hypothetical protein
MEAISSSKTSDDSLDCTVLCPRIQNSSQLILHIKEVSPLNQLIGKNLFMEIRVIAVFLLELYETQILTLSNQNEAGGT